MSKSPGAFLHRLHLNLFLSLSFLFSLQSLSAQPYSSITPQHEVQVYPLNLPGNLIGMNSAVQTADGFLWIASTSGLIISDGHASIIYAKENPKYSLPLDRPDAFLGELHLDSLGGVYALVSTGQKIVRLNRDTRTITAAWSFTDRLQPGAFGFDVSPQGDVYSVLLEKNTYDFSLWRMDTAGQHQLLFEGTKSDYGIYLSYQWFQSMHWIQTSNGIIRITPDGKHFIFHTYSNPNQTNLYKPCKSDYYFFYDHSVRNLMYWDARMDAPKRYTTIPQGLQLNSPLFIVRHEMLYMANGYDFFVLDTLHHTIQDLSATTYAMKKEFYPGALSEDILGFYLIDQQVYLLGSKYLYKLKSKPPPGTEFQNPIPNKRTDVSMRGLAEDEQQNVYASFYNGIVMKAKGDEAFKPWAPVIKLNRDLYSAYSLSYKAPFLFWHSLMINTENGKVSPLIPNTVNGHVVQLLSGDTLYLYTWYQRNLYVYDITNARLDSVRIDSSQNAGSDFPYIINKMIDNSDHTAIWMATRTDGVKLVSKQGKILKSYSIEELGTNLQEGINDLLLDGEFLWYGCFDGLGKLNTNTGEYVFYKDPLITPGMQQRPRTIFTILPDEHQGFYLGSHQGLVYFDTTSFGYTHLAIDHPLAQPEFNRTSAFKDSQGRYYFGSTNGLYSFLPSTLEFQPSEVALNPIKLYGIAIFNGKEKQYRYLSSSLSQLDELVLLPYETNLEFDLSVPSFDHDIYYSYRIKGIHDQWSDYAANPKIIVYALPPGKYTLEVKASANASDNGISTFQIPIRMSAYWYQKAWMWVLLSTGLTAFVAFWIRYWYQQKWKRQKALETLRIKISSDLHDDVGSILSGLAMQSQVMSYEMEEGKRKPMLELSDMSREAMERMRDTVWAIDARKDKYENLIDRMRDFAEKNLERKNITHEFIMHGLEGKKFISPEVRQNIYLIFKEAIVNILKHSNARHVKIQFSQQGDHFSLIIHDDGEHQERGHSDGQGLSNMYLRAKRIGGALHISTNDGYVIQLTG